MNIALSILCLVLIGLLIALYLKLERLKAQLQNKDAELAGANQQLSTAQQALASEADRLRAHYESEAIRLQELAQADANKRIADAQSSAEQAISSAHDSLERRNKELDAEIARVRQHFESEARKAREAAESLVKDTLARLEPLRKYEGLADVERQARNNLSVAVQEANALRAEAQSLIESARAAMKEERAEIIAKATEVRDEADRLLDQAVRDASRIIKDAEARAKEIGGNAYSSLRDKETLDDAVKALWNVVDGYGDKYIIPTRSLLDDLAADFGHTEAGMALKSARDQTRRMVEQGLASDCNYVEEDRKERAKRFVTDAFNGRVDAILTRVKHDNYGTLEQEIKDAFSLVNLNGLAFRDARVLPTYLDARLAELKWAVVAQELKLKAREEQRRIQEQMREEEKVRREQERAIKDAQDKEEAIKLALDKARLEAEHATAQERSKHDAQIAELTKRLAEAEAVKERELSMAQLTRAGNVYIISNIGSFGEDVFKIGMTRRREPMERIWELGDASVPFEFDVHAMIFSDDAPALENLLHTEFEDMRINKVNDRKEFFRLPLQRIRDVVAAKGLNASFTMVAEAHEFRESQALEKMSPEQREKYKHPSSTETTTHD